MRKAMEVLFAVLLMFSGSALAHKTSCYFLLSYGKAKVNYMGTTEIEDRIFRSEYVRGSYTSYPHSNPYAFGLGCSLFKNFVVDDMSLEVTHREGLKATVVSQVGLHEQYGTLDYSTGAYEVKRIGEVQGYSASLVGKKHLFGPIHATAKLGAMYGKGYLAVTSPSIPYNIEAVKRVEGIIPIGGLGLTYSPNKKKWELYLELEKYYTYVNLINFGFRISF